MHKLIFLRQASCCSMYGCSVGYGLGWVDENRPTDNSGRTQFSTDTMINILTVCLHNHYTVCVRVRLYCFMLEFSISLLNIRLKMYEYSVSDDIAVLLFVCLSCSDLEFLGQGFFAYGMV